MVLNCRISHAVRLKKASPIRKVRFLHARVSRSRFELRHDMQCMKALHHLEIVAGRELVSRRGCRMLVLERLVIFKLAAEDILGDMHSRVSIVQPGDLPPRGAGG